MLLLSTCDQGMTLFSKCTSSRRTCLFIIMFFTLSFYFVHVHSLFQMNVGCLIIELLGRTIKWQFLQVWCYTGVTYVRCWVWKVAMYLVCILLSYAYMLSPHIPAAWYCMFTTEIQIKHQPKLVYLNIKTKMK